MKKAYTAIAVACFSFMLAMSAYGEEATISMGCTDLHSIMTVASAAEALSLPERTKAIEPLFEYGACGSFSRPVDVKLQFILYQGRMFETGSPFEVWQMELAEEITGMPEHEAFYGLVAGHSETDEKAL